MIRMVKTWWQRGVPEYVQGREYSTGPLPRGFHSFSEFAGFLVKRGEAEYTDEIDVTAMSSTDRQPRKKKRRKR